MTKGNKEIMNWQNGILLSAVSYAIYLIFWLVLDDDTARLTGMKTKRATV